MAFKIPVFLVKAHKNQTPETMPWNPILEPWKLGQETVESLNPAISLQTLKCTKKEVESLQTLESFESLQTLQIL